MKNLKKRLLALAMAGAMFSLTACGGSTTPASSAAPASSTPAASTAASSEASTEAASGDVITITICDSQPETSLIGQAIKEFGKYLEEESGGRLVLEYYPSAMLGNGTTCMQQVQLGSLDIYRCDASALYDFGVESMKIPGLPYLFKDTAQAIEVVEGEVGQQWLQDITDTDIGFVGFGWLVDTPRTFFTRDREVHKLEDLKGLKIRSVEANLFLDYKSALGMNPVPLAMSEVYTSLSTGVIDAAANTLDSFVSNKFNEVCKYFINNNGMIPAYPMVFSAARWNTFSAEDQQLIIDCWHKAFEYYNTEAVALEEKERADMEAAGVIFCDIEDTERWIEAVQPVVDEYSQGYEDVVAEIRSAWMEQ